MKTALTLVFVYFGMQILGSLLALAFCTGYMLLTGGDFSTIISLSITPSLMLSMVMMFAYLWKFNYLSWTKSTWSIVSPLYLLCTVVITFSGVWLLDMVMSYLPLPDLMEDTFNLLQNSWIGILSVAVVGPVLEELLFRGAITSVLLRRYAPQKAILLSALLFGIVHINPAQVAGAFLIGLLLAWMYYRTRSLLPCIVLHIINNSLAVYLNVTYPEAKNINELIGGNTQVVVIVTIAASVLFIATLWVMQRTRMVSNP